MDEFPIAVPANLRALDWQAHGSAPPTRTLRTPVELEQFSGDWDSIAGPLGTPIQHFTWIRAAARAFGDPLHIVCVRRNGRASAIAPLVVRRSGPTFRLELIGIHELHEPLDFMYADRRDVEALAQEICRVGLPLWLERIPADSALVPALETAMHGRGFVRTRAEAGCPWIPLDESWAEPMQKFTAGRRSDLRRMRRHADTLGVVDFEVVRPTPMNVGALLAEAFRVEAASWKGRTGTALAADPDVKRFFTLYATDAVRRGTLRICFMRIDGRAVAMQIAAECNHRFWLLKIGYDEAYARCSPGSLLMLHTLGYAAKQRLDSYEFLGTDEAWTRVWSPLVRPCVSVRTYPANSRGLLALSSDTLDAAWMKTKTRLVPPS